MANARQMTNKIYDAVNEGLLTWEQVAEAALCYMSEDEVADMAHSNEFFMWEEEDEEDEEYLIDEY